MNRRVMVRGYRTWRADSFFTFTVWSWFCTCCQMHDCGGLIGWREIYDQALEHARSH